MSRTERFLSPLPGNALGGLRRVDQQWTAYKHRTRAIPSVVQVDSDRIGDCKVALGHSTSQLNQLNQWEQPERPEQPEESKSWDVVICGGTLGVLLGAALAQRGWRVALIERGALKGREQEWNVSRRELSVLTTLGLLTTEELEGAIASEYNPARLAFHEGVELWVKDILNVGVDPVSLLEKLKKTFLATGGTLFEHTTFLTATVHPDGVELVIQRTKNQQQENQPQTLLARLVVDAMGHFSPIANQARNGQHPDAVCLVVGTCAQGFSQNETGDLFASFTPLHDQRQYFWEAFPARDGRTTYLFTYMDAHPKRPSLEEVFDDYWRLLPKYQGIELEQLEIIRALFGFFPCYQNSPLQLPWDRMLAVGDSSGSQSPLSFGGFGAMLRHLSRLSSGIHDALTADCLGQRDLALLQPYQPNLSVTWLFQRSMSVGMEQTIAPNQINALLSAVFQQMEALGQPVLTPFLQDVVQLSGLVKTLARTTVYHPVTTAKVIPQVGIGALLNWIVHYVSLAGYTGLSAIAPLLQSWSSSLAPGQRYYVQRWIEAWKYGAGLDHC